MKAVHGLDRTAAMGKPTFGTTNEGTPGTSQMRRMYMWQLVVFTLLCLKI